MDKIKELTKNVLTSLKNNNLNATPKNYFKEFKRQTIDSNIHIKEFELFDEILEQLTPNEYKELHIESFSDLAKILSHRVNDKQLKELLNIFDDVLSPSVDFSQKNEIDDFVKDLSNNPKKIVEKDIIRKIKNISNKRVDADRSVLRKKTDDIIKISSLMEKYFEKSLLESNNSSTEITKIRNELTTLNISTSSQRELGIIQKKLIDTIFNIEESMQNNLVSLDENKQKFSELHETIEKLYKELNQAKKEKSTDFLTNILNRRAYEKEVEKIERKHSLFEAKYALVFIDIDYFKAINDTYGHECGDRVLKSFASILQGLTRQEDILSRYGGEEFITLLNYKDEDEINTYIRRLKKIISTNYFVYKDNKIQLKFSAGIAIRDNYDSYSNTKKSADNLLYKAKQAGRDKIFFDNGTEI